MGFVDSFDRQESADEDGVTEMKMGAEMRMAYEARSVRVNGLSCHGMLRQIVFQCTRKISALEVFLG